MSVKAIDRRVADLARRRRLRVLAQAADEGLLGPAKDRRIASRVPSQLVDAAKRRSGVSTDSELIEFALSSVALQDDFAAALLSRWGSVPADIDLEF